MDQRIEDLRERLHKKRAEVNSFSLIVDWPHRGLCSSVILCSARFQLSRMNGGGPAPPQTSAHPGGGVSSRVAAVCPYIQVPVEGRKDAGYPLLADPPPKHTPLSHIRSLSGW